MRYKKFPETVSITEDDSAVVVGWTGERSFIVKTLDKVTNSAETVFDLDETEDANTEVISLWDWAIINDLSVKDLNDLQDNLESYISLSDEEVSI